MYITYKKSWKGLMVLFFISILLSLKSTDATAFVSAINGNYSVSFSDITHPQSREEHKLKVSRTYNSKSQYDGMFGYGWGSVFESFLIVSADGSVVINQGGGGEKIRFIGKFKPKVLNRQIERLVKEKQAQMKKEGTKFNAKDIIAYRKKLQKDADFRDEEGRVLKVAPKLPSGTRLYSTGRENKQTITVLKNGFIRTYEDNKKEYFMKKVKVSDLGIGVKQRRILEAYKITRKENPTKGVVIKYTYDRIGNLQTVTSGRQALYFSTANGKVTQVKNALGQIASYEQCPAIEHYSIRLKCGPGDLIKSRDTAGNVYSFEYDSAHNITKLITKEADAKLTHAEQFFYWPLASPGVFQPGSGGVKKRIFRGGMEKTYTYWADPVNPKLHTRTDTVTTYKDGRKTKASYEFWRKRRRDGSNYTYKTVSNIRNLITETIYNSCCKQPIRIKKGKKVTTFTYDPKTQLLIRKEDPKEIKTWVYYQKRHFGKPRKISITDKRTKITRSVSFGFNVRGNLRYAKTSDGKSIAITYDNMNRMKLLIDHKKRKILLNYNELSKPELIRQQGVGAIRLIYEKDSGKVKNFKIEKGDSKTAFNIAYAFQDALKIIKFAGIEPI